MREKLGGGKAMDMIDIEVFIQVVERKSMNKAAGFLHISQSAVSSRIANLEMELDTVLFIRSKSGVTLTMNGRKFYSSAVKAFNMIHTGIKNMKESKEEKHVISIGITESLVHNILPSVSSIISNYPTLEWKIVTGRSKELIFQIESNELDIALINDDPILEDKDIEKTTIFEEKIMLIGPAHYSKNWKTLQYFIQESTIVLLEKGMPLRNVVENQIFKPLNIYPKKQIEVNTTELLKEFVSNGIGFTFMPLSSLWQESVVTQRQDLAKGDRRIFRVMDLEVIHPYQKCVCIYPPSVNKTISKISDLLKKELMNNIQQYKSQSEWII
jgi:DNA-binding transcriptional LysR family regulator